ncbi:hypothetical protein J5893_01365 [bacterium]|nr:hypothetical protein [bacterium]
MTKKETYLLEIGNLLTEVEEFRKNVRNVLIDVIEYTHTGPGIGEKECALRMKSMLLGDIEMELHNAEKLLIQKIIALINMSEQEVLSMNYTTEITIFLEGVKEYKKFREATLEEIKETVEKFKNTETSKE